MPLKFTTKQKQKGIPACQLKNKQIAKITNAGEFYDEHIGEVVIRVGDDLISLSGILDESGVFNDACAAGKNDVIVRLIPNGTHLEITDNE